jgi:hypothetical protein
MAQQMINEELWAALERAVRTYTESLPVDAFLPDPEDQVARLMQKRAEKIKPVHVEEEQEFVIQEDSLQEIVDETEILENPPAPVNESKDLDAELRSQLSGNDFAELDDM